MVSWLVSPGRSEKKWNYSRKSCQPPFPVSRVDYNTIWCQLRNSLAFSNWSWKAVDLSFSVLLSCWTECGGFSFFRNVLIKSHEGITTAIYKVPTWSTKRRATAPVFHCPQHLAVIWSRKVLLCSLTWEWLGATHLSMFFAKLFFSSQCWCHLGNKIQAISYLKSFYLSRVVSDSSLSREERFGPCNWSSTKERFAAIPHKFVEQIFPPQSMFDWDFCTFYVSC